MKINPPSAFLRFLFATGLSAAALAWADEGSSTATIKLSSPGKPATLRVNVPWADIHIVGVDGETVTVGSTLGQKGAQENRADGLRRLDDEVSFELTEHDNIVSLQLAGDSPWSSHDTEFRISVPRTMALDVKTGTGGELEVRDVEGDIEVNNMNGEVLLEGIAGSAIVNTMNGEVRAIYARAPQKPVSITSMNGEIELRVPGDTKANVRLRTQNGSILTDFDEAVLKTKSEGKGRDGGNDGAARVAMQAAKEAKREAERAAREAAGATEATPVAAPRPPHAPIPPIVGGKVVSGTLNGGGIDINISTMNGEITLRQAAPGNVAIMFRDPDKFTDVLENQSFETSTYYLDQLKECLQQTALPLLAPGQKLVITVTDVDLAGETRFNQPSNIRVLKDIYAPRVELRFQLLDAGGKVVKEGERRLIDLDYLLQAGRPGSQDPLYYDKALLKQWVRNEFKAKT